MQKLTRSLFALGMLAGLAACGDDVSITEPPKPTPAVTGIAVTPGAATLSVGQTAQLSAVVTTNDPSVATTVTWASSNTAVATVSATGLVTAVAPGAATITATSTANANFKAGAQITVNPRDLGVRSVRISPDNAIVTTGTTLQLVANVDANAGVARTVTWASSNTAVATVSTTGVVTGVAPGSATITATSTADPSVSGASAITVRNPVPATISIAAITAGALNVPVNVNNVAGQIEVTLNVDPGSQVISGVEVLIDGQVAASQTFSASRSMELALSHVFANVQAAPVTLSINTALFDAASGAVKWFNGVRKISARANIQGGTSVATPSQDLTFNNLSGAVLGVSNDNGADAKSVVNPAQGLTWIGGSVTITATGVSYIQGVTITSVTLGNFGTGFLFGKTSGNVIALTATTTPAGFAGGGSTGSITYTEATNWTATNSGVNRYQTAGTVAIAPNPAVIGEAPGVAATLLSNGQNGPAITLNFPANPIGNANVSVVPIIRLDNVGPGAASLNGVVQPTITLGSMGIWVRAATSFAAGASGIPTQTTLNASDTGADVVTVQTFIGATGTLPGGFTAGGGPAASCSTTGLTAHTTGATLTETIVSTTYQGRVVLRDGLGNISCHDLNPIDPFAVANGSFGADFTAPSGTISAGSPAANSAFTSAGAVPNFTVSATDNASGFGPTPLLVRINRTNPAASGRCVFGTTPTGSTNVCVNAEAQALTFNPIGGVAAPTNEGYYDVTIDLRDQAGNLVNLVTNRFLLLDDPAVLASPATADISFNGGISLPSLIAGATTNNFSFTPRDDMDMNSVFGVATYPADFIRYPNQSLGAYNTPFETGNTAVNYGVANWMRCLNQATDFATTTNKPTDITLTISDQAGNTATQTSPAFGANAQNCGAVGDSPINTFGPLTVTFPTGKTQIDIDGANMVTASTETVTLSVVADVPLNTSVSPFTRVDFYFQDTGGNLRSVGSATGVLSQTPTNRTWTFTFVWNPDSQVQAGTVNLVAIGMDSQGDAVKSNATGAVQVTTVP